MYIPIIHYKLDESQHLKFIFCNFIDYYKIVIFAMISSKRLLLIKQLNVQELTVRFYYLNTNIVKVKLIHNNFLFILF